MHTFQLYLMETARTGCSDSQLRSSPLARPRELRSLRANKLGSKIQEPTQGKGEYEGFFSDVVSIKDVMFPSKSIGLTNGRWRLFTAILSGIQWGGTAFDLGSGDWGDMVGTLVLFLQ